MVDLSIEEGVALVKKARKLGINIFDAHHRYGNCEKILKEAETVIQRPDEAYYKMTKVSAYEYENRWTHVERSIELLKYIDIMWISDLDNEELYKRGSEMYKEIGPHFPSVGITTEDPGLAMKFLNEFPECKFYMIPVFASRPEMYHCACALHESGKYVFSIKPFDDGREFKRQYSVRDCLKYLKRTPIDVVVFGTKDVEHLEEVVELWESIKS